MSQVQKLSKESKDFLENLSVYLFSSGKNDDEIDSIVEELEVHLLEAEKNGKSIDNIIGKSPKQYMKQLSKEMDVDYSAWLKYIPIIIIGFFTVDLITDIMQGDLSYSLLEVFGDAFIMALYLVMVFGAFKYIAASNASLKIEVTILLLVSMVPIGLFIGLIYLNKLIETPMIHFGLTGTIMVGVFSLVFIIALSIWAKTWILIVVVSFITLPEYLLAQTSLTSDTQMLLGSLITFGGIAIYFWVTHQREKGKELVEE